MSDKGSVMDYWLNISFSPIGQYVALAELAEACGFTGVVVSDHLVTPAELSSAYPYGTGGSTRWPEDTHWPDCWIAITAMAARTTRLRFATSIFIAPLREPIALAKAIGTAAIFSGDRLACGFGSGWMQEEFDVVGIPFANRAKRMDEMLAIMGALWSGDMIEHHGQVFDFARVQMRPEPAQPIPVWIGGHADAALRRAARHDGWIAAHTSIEGTTADLGKLETILEAAGKPRDACYVLATISSRRHLADLAELERIGTNGVALPANIIDNSADLDVKSASIRAFARQHIAAPTTSSQEYAGD